MGSEEIIGVAEIFKPEPPTGRDYTIYGRSLAASTESKFTSIAREFGVVPDGAVIVDVGSGTGDLAEKVAESYRACGVRLYAVDRSHELHEMASDQSLIDLVYDDALELKNIPDGSADIIYHGTMGHEVASENGEAGVRKMIKVAWHKLKPGGREVMRDMVKPSYHGNVFMRIDVRDGVDTPAAASINGYLDYNKLSTRALFDRFYEEFLGGRAFDYWIRIIDNREFIELPAEFAHEFMLRKDYTANWRSEIKEKYTYWTTEEAARAFTEAGFTDVKVTPDDNAYIRQNRFKGKVALFVKNAGGALEETELLTHMVISGRKPGEKGASESVPRATNYPELIKSIAIDEATGTVRIGAKTLNIGESVGYGTHKRVYKNPGDGGKSVIKVVRQDVVNVHNVFKSMLQAIERQGVLDEYEVPHVKILDWDREGPPYRYLIQETLPPGAVSAATLIREGRLSEEDIAQMAKIVNRFEKGKIWQLDMSPYNWNRVTLGSGKTQMVYAGSTVYSYDERWTFGRVGVPQWSLPAFVPETAQKSAVIPRRKEIAQFMENLDTTDNQTVKWWKKYLSPAVFPEKEATAQT